MSRPVLNCVDPDWGSRLLAYVSSQTEVDLINFDYNKHGGLCEDVARRHGMEIMLDRDPSVKTLHFRKREK
jgi:hypothetical protein